MDATEVFKQDENGDDPVRIGRYEVKRKLGAGTFGTVYLARDLELSRLVAVKVPLMVGPEHEKAYLAEARVAASLDHPNVVPVYDVGRMKDGRVYVVSKYIEGCSLREQMAAGGGSYFESARIVAGVASGLQAAHQLGLIHRDVKPSNILLDEHGHPFLADFGLAQTEEHLVGSSEVAGTPAYMSPEQIRGEGHRVDGRSDVFSLGVVLYQLLTGKRPFRSDSREQLFRLITQADVKPPRQYAPQIPRELERICVKCLAKRAVDRYATSLDLADDLNAFADGHALSFGSIDETADYVSAGTAESTPHGDSTVRPVGSESDADTVGSRGGGSATDMSRTQQLHVVPKGLRSFDSGDAGFFLRLLPGPYDRLGVPETVRFWKSRIEDVSADAGRAAVGLIYGPSGCGKSSFVKAGLLPRLNDGVETVYVEAGSSGTDERLLRALQHRDADLADVNRLSEAALRTRRRLESGGGGKLLIVIDQFEQWLHPRHTFDDLDLTLALRQCDGEHLQCLLLVRDDFWLSVSRFMQELEIPLIEGTNCGLIDLFDLRHARRVLAAFGRAFERLPHDDRDMSPEQLRFVERAVDDLATDGKVVCVRLALFAEMMKGKSWTVQTLRNLGGAAGVGVTFLEESFAAATAPPAHRVHQHAARRVLRSLLPESDSAIRGTRRRVSELVTLSGYADRPRDFEALIRILDPETRLITPADVHDEANDAEAESYQLTHDYLVASLRIWLTQKQMETARGRAAMTLAEQARLWAVRRENRLLPPAWQWLRFRTLTARRNWNDAERQMMKHATRRHVLRGGMLTALLVVAVLIAGAAQREVTNERRTSAAQALVTRLADAETAEVPRIIEEMDGYGTELDRLLDARISRVNNERSRRHLLLARLQRQIVPADQLLPWLRNASAAEFRILAPALRPYRNELLPDLWQAAARPEQSDPVAIACALATFDPEDDRWGELGATISQELIHLNPLLLASRVEDFVPVRRHLTPHLIRVFRDTDPERATERAQATVILSRLVADDPNLLLRLLAESDPQQFQQLFPLVSDHRDAAVRFFNRKLSGQPESQQPGLPATGAWSDADPATRAQIESAGGLLTDQFAIALDVPLAEFRDLAARLAGSGYRPARIRPVAAGGRSLSVLWERDGRKWEMDTDLTAEEVTERTERLRTSGRFIADVSGYQTTAAERPGVRYTALWIDGHELVEDAVLLIGGSRRSLSALQQTAQQGVTYAQSADSLSRKGFVAHSLQVLRLGIAAPEYSAVWWKPAGDALVDSADASAITLDGEEVLDMVRHDIDVRPWGVSAAEQLANAESRLQGSSHSGFYRYRRARANLMLGRSDGVVEDLQATREAAAQRPVLWAPYPDKNGSVQFDPAGRGESQAIRMTVAQPAYLTLTQVVPVRRGRDYLVSGWVRTQAVRILGQGGYVGAALSVRVPHLYSQTVVADTDWTYLALVFNSGTLGTASVRLQLGNYLTTVTGDAWFDDLCMIELSADESAHPLLRRPEFLNAARKQRNLIRNPDCEPECAEFDASLIVAWCRTQQWDKARSLLETTEQKFGAERDYLHALVNANTEQLRELLKRLEPATIEPETAPLLWAARTWAGLSVLTAAATDSRAATFDDRAVQLLRRGLMSGIIDRIDLNLDPELARLLQHPELISALSAEVPIDVGIWQADAESETRTLRGLNKEQHAREARMLVQSGFRPTTLSARRRDDEAVYWSGWRRHRVVPAAREESLREQANAAIALHRMGFSDAIFSRLQHQPDPTLRSLLLSRMSLSGLSVDDVLQKLESESETSTRRALLWATGLLLRSDSPDEVQQRVVSMCLALYRSDPDSGVHGAAEWVLRNRVRTGDDAARENVLKRLQAADLELAGKEQIDRNWTVTQSGHTLVHLDGRESFLMGSPGHERGRGRTEKLHRRQIHRRFAIAAREVTIGDFERFLVEHPQFRHPIPPELAASDDRPRIDLRWYDAVAYCRWLSEKEDVPESEMCYPSIDQINERMVLPPDYLQRTGYRVPTEAEWEFAARAGAVTSWYHGAAEELLPMYAWFGGSSGGTTHPVAALIPNDNGLFDMLGNGKEWCSGRFSYYSYNLRGSTVDDRDVPLVSTQTKPLRGGAFDNFASAVRNAYRLGDPPSNRYYSYGFRIARTLR